MPEVQLSTVTSTSEWHEYEAPAPLAFADEAHFEVRHANNPWGYEVEDRVHGKTYTKGFFDIAAPGTGGGGNPVITALMLCNPYASAYAGVDWDGPADPLVWINGVFNAGANLAGFSGPTPNGVLWTNNGQAYYPQIAAGTAVPFGVNGAVRIAGKNPGYADRIFGPGVGEFGPAGQAFPMLGIAYKNLTLMPPTNFLATFNCGVGTRWGRVTAYDCRMKGNPSSAGFGGGVKMHFRFPGPGCVDLRDLVCDFAEEHFYYANSTNHGYVDGDSWILRCSTPQGLGRTFCQILHRFEEAPYAGRNTILIEDCEMLGCAQQQQSAVFTVAGFHGTVIVRDCEDAPIPVVAPIQKRSIVVWEPGNKSPEPLVDEGNIYKTSEHSGTNGIMVVINHTTTAPSLVDSSHWAFNGCQEVHIFEPHITGNKRAIEFDHAAQLGAGPQYDENGVKGWDPDLSGPPGAAVFSNNPYHTASLKRASVNGPGMTAGAIGPGYEHIYTPGASFSEWTGINVSGAVLARNDASSSHPLSDGGPFSTLDPEDYWSPIQFGMGGSSTMTATMSVTVALATSIAGSSFCAGLLTAGDPGGASMFSLARGVGALTAALSVSLDLAASIAGQSLMLGLLTSGESETMIATADGSAAMSASLSTLVDLSASAVCSSTMTGSLTTGRALPLVCLIDGNANVSAAPNFLVDISAEMEGQSFLDASLFSNTAEAVGDVELDLIVNTFAESDLETALTVKLELTLLE